MEIFIVLGIIFIVQIATVLLVFKTNDKSFIDVSDFVMAFIPIIGYIFLAIELLFMYHKSNRGYYK